MSFAANLWLILLAAGLGRECSAPPGPTDPSTTATKPEHDTDWMSEIESIKDRKVDKDWQEYVDAVGGEYEEVPRGQTPQNDEDDPLYHKELIDWNPTSPREVPYLAVIFTKDKGPTQQYKDFFKGEPDPGISHIEPHKACGGALISQSHVLTVCGCLAYLISSEVFYLGQHLFDDKNQQFDIENPSNTRSPPRVFVAFSFMQFEPTAEAEVIYQRAKWPKNAGLNCNRLIKTGFYNATIPKFGALRADGELVAVPFKNGPEVAIYPAWPTPVFYDPDYKKVVTVASIGMRLIEKTVVKFDSSISVSSLKLRHCYEFNEYCSERIFIMDPKEANNTNPHNETSHICCCRITKERKAQLVGGVIGWPVLDDEGNLIGLTATERRSTDGALVVALINKYRRQMIEEYVGKNILQTQNLEAAVYRQKDLGNKYWVYDYWSQDSKKKGGKSGAAKLFVNLFHLFLAFIAFPRFVRL